MCCPAISQSHSAPPQMTHMALRVRTCRQLCKLLLPARLNLLHTSCHFYWRNWHPASGGALLPFYCLCPPLFLVAHAIAPKTFRLWHAFITKLILTLRSSSKQLSQAGVDPWSCSGALLTYDSPLQAGEVGCIVNAWPVRDWVGWCGPGGALRTPASLGGLAS